MRAQPEHNQSPPAALQAPEPHFDELYADAWEREVAAVAKLLAALPANRPHSNPPPLPRLLLVAAGALKRDIVPRPGHARFRLPAFDFSATKEATR